MFHIKEFQNKHLCKELALLLQVSMISL